MVEWLTQEKYNKEREEFINKIVTEDTPTISSFMMIKLFQETHKVKSFWNKIKYYLNIIDFQLLFYGGLLVYFIGLGIVMILNIFISF